MKPRIKPRNPLVAPTLFRKAGPHRKAFKALRRDAKVRMCKELDGLSGKSRSRNAALAFFREGGQASISV